MHPKKKQKLQQKKIAEERIIELFDLAEKNFAKYPERSHRYAELIRKIQLKFKIKLPLKIKRRICKKCDKFLKPGMNCKIRTKEGKLVIHCLECKNMVRIPYKKINKC
jgi:ribonuclease P protein subunit RPR2